MPCPDKRELETATRNIVLNTENISQLTPRVVRELLEKQYSLDKGTLDASEFKKPIKSFIDAAVAERREEKAKEISSGPATSERNSDDEDETPSAKRKRDSSSGKAKSTKKYKSASVIATSDIEEDEPIPPPASKPVKAGVPTPKPKPPPKPKAEPKKTEPKASSSRISSQVENDDGSESASPSGASKAALKAQHKSASPPDDDESASEVENQPPKKRRKSKSDDKSSTKSAAKPKRAKKTESKDDATIKKLKSYVAACGVRKQWGKIFEDVESTSRQISIIKDILKDLGMDGRMSLDQAKRIREQRELAADLEDVQSFEKSALVRGSRSRRGQPESKPAKREEVDASDEETEKPVARKPTARQSIMAFLGSDSESD
ncbi:hypothetical protein BDZ89DRAFT_1154803 [Hymenopellis radicata]|nr:hypothetical protein BDZ89DRAFT_1154803 [Hymenopellis radicata]